MRIITEITINFNAEEAVLVDNFFNLMDAISMLLSEKSPALQDQLIDLAGDLSSFLEENSDVF